MDLEHNQLPKCPHCGHNERDAWEIDFSRSDTKTTSCGSCERDYVVTRYVDVTYSTTELRETRTLRFVSNEGGT
jgi:transcription elongation factor Elf1